MQNKDINMALRTLPSEQSIQDFPLSDLINQSLQRTANES